MSNSNTAQITASQRFLRWWPALLGSLLFVLLGSLFMLYPGLQNDEVLFAAPLYQPAGTVYLINLNGTRVPVMLLSYLGAWKTWVYAPILKRWRPSPVSVRWPVAAICAVTICIFFGLLHAAHGWRAAAIGSLLLATDSSYLLTGLFDWGPIAFQHLFLIVTMAFAVRFHRTGSLWALGWAALCAGLGLWDKALFVWPLGGLLVALITVFPHEFRRSLTRRAIPVVALGFSVGAFPLIAFNATHHFETFRSNSKFTFSEFGKYIVLEAAWNGSVLFGYLTNEEEAPQPRAPETRLERWSSALHDLAGTRRKNWMPWGLLAALVLFPFLWRTAARKPMLFALVACTVGWLQMAITQNAGGSAHHVILLWPLPYFLVAVAFAQASFFLKQAGAWLAPVATLVLMTGNLLNLNQYFYQLARYGAAGSWTDAIFALSNGVDKIPTSSPLMVADWGILNTLNVLHRGQLNLRVASGPFESETPSEEQRKLAAEMFAEKSAVWLRYTPGHEQFRGIDERLDRRAAEAGYREELVATYSDRNGRPILEALRLERQSP